MPIEIAVQCADVANVPSDLLLLKHAQNFYGADEAVANRLIERGICKQSEISPKLGEHVLLSTGRAIAPVQTLFFGTKKLREFRYREMKQFTRLAIETIGKQQLPIRTLTTTVHGAGYGLDVAESFRAMIFGFQQGLATTPLPSLESIVFVEHNSRRCEQLQKLLEDVEIVSAPHSFPTGPSGATGVSVTLQVDQSPKPEIERRKSVFVAMPFTEEFEDVYQFGIYTTVRRCGYICEKVDESLFAGSIIDRIMDGIRDAEFVIADLTLEKPNVYLEVGYAWGTKKPVLLIAREGQRLHFDLSHHKCVFYKTIGKLAESLEKSILEMFGRGNTDG